MSSDLGIVLVVAYGLVAVYGNGLVAPRVHHRLQASRSPGTAGALTGLLCLLMMLTGAALVLALVRAASRSTETGAAAR